MARARYTGLLVLGMLMANACALMNLPSSEGEATLTSQSETLALPVVTPLSTGYPEDAALSLDTATQTQAAVETIVAEKNQMAATAFAELTAATPLLTQVCVPAGIRDDEYVQAQAKMLPMAVENAWGGCVDGAAVGVWAGRGSEPQSGVVHVMMFFPDRAFEQRYFTEDRHGALRIVAEHNNRLTLVSTDGTTFYFDVPARRFVSSLTEIASTSEPPPTYTPFAPQPTIPLPTPYPNPVTPASP